MTDEQRTRVLMAGIGEIQTYQVHEYELEALRRGNLNQTDSAGLQISLGGLIGLATCWVTWVPDESAWRIGVLSGLSVAVYFGVRTWRGRNDVDEIVKRIKARGEGEAAREPSPVVIEASE